GIRTCRERELQHPMRVGVPHLTVGERTREAVEARTASPDDELPDPSRRIGRPTRRLRSEPLVLVVVSADDDRGARCVQRIPEVVDRGIAALIGTGAEAWGWP